MASEEQLAPNQRTFGLNSQEFYEAVVEPRERPWIPNGSLPREPRRRELEVIVEPTSARPSRRQARAAHSVRPV